MSFSPVGCGPFSTRDQRLGTAFLDLCPEPFPASLGLFLSFGRGVQQPLVACGLCDLVQNHPSKLRAVCEHVQPLEVYEEQNAGGLVVRGKNGGPFGNLFLGVRSRRVSFVSLGMRDKEFHLVGAT